MNINISVNTEHLENIIHSLHVLTAALATDHDTTTEGILSAKGRSRGENAIDFLQEYHDTTSGALLLMAAASGILSDAILNGELLLSPGRFGTDQERKVG